MRNRRVYIAEDQPQQASLMERMLEELEGVHCTFFPNGLDLFLRCVEDPPDLIITDVVLPKLTGLAVARLIKFHDEFRHIPVIVMSSFADYQSKTTAAQVGADDFIPKPFTTEDFLTVVKGLLPEGGRGERGRHPSGIA